MMWRALALIGAMVSTSVYLAHAARAEPTPIRQPLSALPLEIGEWRGRLEPNLTPEILAVLRVDDYTTRMYWRPSGAVGLYVGYHATQRQGAAIHSPLNCLPGAGWVPVSQARLPLVVASGDRTARPIEINRVEIAKGLDRQLVLYWYQSHGRVVASEYWGKAYSVYDAIRFNRTDAALVRVLAPVAEGGTEAMQRAEREAVAFVQAIFPLLGEYLPS
jgi:EpsI family protein